MPQRFVESALVQKDEQFEQPLRPKALSEFIGQEVVREQLSILIEAAKFRGDILGHCLFCGPPGLGKTTLSHIIADSMGAGIVVTSGPALERPSDLAGILNSLRKGDIFFIDEIHRLNRAVEEYLYSALEDFVLDIVVDSAAQAKSVRLPLNPFTLVGATTRLGLLSAPFRSRFAFSTRLDLYPVDTLSKIVVRTGEIFGMRIDVDSAHEISRRSRGTPRIANNLIRWVRDFCTIRHKGIVSLPNVQQALDMIAIDEAGLDEMDIKILDVIESRFKGGPVGLQTLSIAIGEEPGTLEEVYEPYLIGLGFIEKTPRGREITEGGKKHLKNRRQQTSSTRRS